MIPGTFILEVMLVASLMIGCSHSVEGLRPVFPLQLLVDRDGLCGFSAHSIVLRQRQAMAKIDTGQSPVNNHQQQLDLLRITSI